MDNNSRTVAVSIVHNGVDLGASIAGPGRLTPGVNVPVADGQFTVTGTAQEPNTANNTVPIEITVTG